VFVNGRIGEMGPDTFVGNTVWLGNPDAAPEALDDEPESY